MLLLAIVVALPTRHARGKLSGESSVQKGGVDAEGSGSSLLEKYTFRETVKTVIDEDNLPELPAFLEALGLGGKLNVSAEVGGQWPNRQPTPLVCT